MKKWLVRFIVLAALAGLVFWAWRALIPTPERAIRKQLAELARTASFGPNEGALAKLENAGQVANFFADDAQLRLELLGYGQQNLEGREQVRGVAMQARNALAGLRVNFLDIKVTVGADDRSAMVDLTAESRASGDSGPQAYGLKLTMRRIGGDWLIKRLETSKTLF
jgi:hypothetical protein